MNHVADMNNCILSCDWGTSSFRLRLVDLHTHTILEEVLSGDGISLVYQAWKSNTQPSNISRAKFYNQQLLQQIRKLNNHTHSDFNNIPLIISGMASSTLGLTYLPYAALPFDIDGSGLIIELLENNEQLPHDIYLISGVSNASDVMRGEETQLIGVFELLKQELERTEKEIVLIFPGTHSKHIFVQHGQITGFTTFVTGELFALMNSKSILQESVTLPGADHVPDTDEIEAFKTGVRSAQSGSLIKDLFKVRANWLLKVYNKRQNYFYLSGLLIGAELSELENGLQQQLVLCSGSHLYELYRIAFEVLMMPVKLVPAGMMEKAVIEGQIKIFQDIILQSQKKYD